MGKIRRLVLDVLKPHDPTIIQLASQLSELDGVEAVNISIYEIDLRVENAKIGTFGLLPSLPLDKGRSHIVGDISHHSSKALGFSAVYTGHSVLAIYRQLLKNIAQGSTGNVLKSAFLLLNMPKMYPESLTALRIFRLVDEGICKAAVRIVGLANWSLVVDVFSFVLSSPEPENRNRRRRAELLIRLARSKKSTLVLHALDIAVRDNPLFQQKLTFAEPFKTIAQASRVAIADGALESSTKRSIDAAVRSNGVEKFRNDVKILASGWEVTKRTDLVILIIASSLIKPELEREEGPDICTEMIRADIQKMERNAFGYFEDYVVSLQGDEWSSEIRNFDPRYGWPNPPPLSVGWTGAHLPV